MAKFFRQALKEKDGTNAFPDVHNKHKKIEQIVRTILISKILSMIMILKTLGAILRTGGDQNMIDRGSLPKASSSLIRKWRSHKYRCPFVSKRNIANNK